MGFFKEPESWRHGNLEYESTERGNGSVLIQDGCIYIYGYQSEAMPITNQRELDDLIAVLQRHREDLP